MKFLNREEIYKINEAAVDYDDSITKMFIGWIKGLSSRSRLRGLAMQWGAQYGLALDKTYEEYYNSDKDAEDAEDESDNIDDMDDDDINAEGVTIADEESIYNHENRTELIVNISQYINGMLSIKKEFEEIIKNASSNDILKIRTDFHGLKMIQLVGEKRFQKIFEALIGYKDDGALANVEQIDKMQDEVDVLEKNIQLFVDEHKREQLKVIYESYINYIKFVTELYNAVRKVRAHDTPNYEKQQQKAKEEEEQRTAKEENTDENTDKENTEKNEQYINEAIFGGKKIDIPSKVTDLFPEDLLEKAAKIDNVKQRVAKNMNYARLNSIRYEAEYIIDSIEDNKKQAKARREFDSIILSVNDYFQNVVDVDDIMTRITGKVDASIEKTVKNRQDELNDIQNMGIVDVKSDSKFDSSEVYAFQSVVRGSVANTKSTILFLSPIASNYKTKYANGNFFIMRYLGSYTYDKKSKKVMRVNPLTTLITSKKTKALLEKNGSEIKYLAINGLQTGTAKFTAIFGIMNKGELNFVNVENFVDVDKISSFDFDKSFNAKDNLKKIIDKNGGIQVTFKQRYVVPKDKIDSKTYPGLDSSTIKPNPNDDEKALKGFKKLFNAI